MSSQIQTETAGWSETLGGKGHNGFTTSTSSPEQGRVLDTLEIIQKTEKMHVGWSWRILNVSSSHFSAPQDGATDSKSSKLRKQRCAVQ